MKKKLLTVLLSGAIFCGGVQASASSNFFADVPADSCATKEELDEFLKR